jgi:uncharacterized protein YceH (UPF0502 family)
MKAPLSPEEIRIIGCLMEKAVTTPEQYPLTANSLMLACNQKTSRDPVMNLELGEVIRLCQKLKEKHLLNIEENFRSGSTKYTHRFCNSMLGTYQFNPAEYALVCLLLLRGPQTPGELRSRSGRLHSFDTPQDVVTSLEALMAHPSGPVVARLPRQPGRQDHQYMHTFAGAIDSVLEDDLVVQRAPMSSGGTALARLEARVAVLENALLQLASRLGEDIDLGPNQESSPIADTE